MGGPDTFPLKRFDISHYSTKARCPYIIGRAIVVTNKERATGEE